MAIKNTILGEKIPNASLECDVCSYVTTRFELEN